ncbi:MAG: hypothetical protein WDO24_23645 [Pseudomonadota bacterium]
MVQPDDGMMMSEPVPPIDSDVPRTWGLKEITTTPSNVPSGRFKRRDRSISGSPFGSENSGLPMNIARSSCPTCTAK